MVLKQGQQRDIERAVAAAIAQIQKQFLIADRERVHEVGADLTLKADVTVVDALDTRVTTAESDVDAVELRLDAEETATAAAIARMDTAESDIDAVELRMDAEETATADHETRIAAAEASIAANEWAAVPASASATGTPGQLAYEPGWFYVCVATDTWERVAIAAWV